MDEVKKHFEEEAFEFDGIILKLIPDYPQMVEALVSALPFHKTNVIQGIDLGCGTGTVTQAILNTFPHAQFSCLDIAENMIKIARSKLRKHKNVRYIVGDFSSFEGQYDVVVSSLALHHLITEDDKRQFYRRIHDALLPGGVFYNADIVLGSSKFLQDAYMGQWRAFMHRQIPEQEIEGKWIPKYEAEDHPARLLDHLAWLAEAGFSDIDVVWKRSNFAVYGGLKR